MRRCARVGLGGQVAVGRADPAAGAQTQCQDRGDEGCSVFLAHEVLFPVRSFPVLCQRYPTLGFSLYKCPSALGRRDLRQRGTGAPAASDSGSETLCQHPPARLGMLALLAQVFREQMLELVTADGLGEEVVTARVETALPTSAHGVCREGDDRMRVSQAA